jgi:hypothetical protein
LSLPYVARRQNILATTGAENFFHETMSCFQVSRRGASFGVGWG